MAQETQVLVIGGGPGGYVAAIKLGKLGKKVLLVDKDGKLGGECLNYGCIPSKALIHSAGEYYKASKTWADAVGGQGLKTDWKKIQAWRANLLGGFNRGIAGLCKGNGVTVLFGTAKFTGFNSALVQTASGEEAVKFESAVIATGTVPSPLPGFAYDGKNVIGSKEALELSEIPQSLAVIGGGVIGLEIGMTYAKLGAQVAVVEVMPQILPGVDPDLIGPVSRNLQKLGVAVHVNSKAKGFAEGGGRLSLSVETPEGPKEISCDKILVSVGRRAQTGDLGLKEAGVETDPRGHVKVDASGKSSASHIYAIGDVSGPPYLAHKASREGILAALSIAGRANEERGFIPSAIFTDPEIAFVGETEAEAKARGVQVMSGRFPFSASGRAQAVRSAEGFVKIIADANTHKILGCGIVGPEAADLIGEACLAVKLGATVDQIAATVHPHPTLSEAFQEAAEACLGQAIHILAPAARS